MTADITNPRGEFKPCGEGDNICSCKSADECGYLITKYDELIQFAMYLTGHDRETIVQMYEDWNKFRKP